MTGRTVKTLAAVAVGLVLLLVAIETFNHRSAVERTTLLPEFAAHAADIDNLRIVVPDDGIPITIGKDGERWVVAEADGYPADVGKLRDLVTALSDAVIVEKKTSNPDLYDKLGLGDPSEGGSGTKVVADAGAYSATVIFGNSTQGTRRYVRLPDEATSFLVDKSPTLPVAASDWLDPAIVDVPEAGIIDVTIAHTDGERIELGRPDTEATNFEALNLPEGRELSYPSAGNGIAGALGSLQLEAVRPASGAEPATTVTFHTDKGLEIVVNVIDEVAPEAPAPDGDDEAAAEPPEPEHWFSFSATATGDEARADADALNERVKGWEYRLPTFKAQLLTKRWDDLLKEPPAAP